MTVNAIATGYFTGSVIPRPVAPAVSDPTARLEAKEFAAIERSATGASQASDTKVAAPAGNAKAADADANSLKARLAAEQEKADQQLLQQLRSRDREVRQHEAAHAAVGGRYAGSPSFDYQRGPDGAQYAVGGEVPISTSSIPGDPRATLEKARVIRAAALAPAEPSAQDRRVAAEASQMTIEAQSELLRMEQEAKQVEQSSQADSAETEQAADQSAADVINKPAKTDAEEDQREGLPSTAQSDAAADNRSAADQQPGAVSANAAQDDTEKGERGTQQDTGNARESLEKILLAGKTVAQKLNEMGLIDAQNPYGKSGLIEFIV